MIFNYFLSGCTENLGVVPLFLFSAFLFFPALAFLFSRLILVTAVLDTIFQLLNTYIYRFAFLRCAHGFVKIFFIPLIFLQFCLQLRADSEVKSYEFTLTKGEILEFKCPDLINFTLSSPESLSAKWLPHRSILLIKGKKQGYAEIHIWAQSNKKVLKFYIVRSTEQRKLKQLKESLNALGLSTSTMGALVSVKGTIKTKEGLKSYNLLKSESKFPIHSNVHVSKKLSRQIITEAYELFVSLGHWNFYCKDQKADINCYVYSASQKNKIKTDLPIQIYWTDTESSKNLKIKLQLWKFEASDLVEYGFGLYDLDQSLKSALTASSIKELFSQNSITLKGMSGESGLWANHESLIIPGKKFNIRVGSESAFQIKSNEVTTTTWKFSGVEIQATVFEKNGHYELEYDFQMTKNSDGSIQGPKGSSTIVIDLNRPVNLFKITVDEIDDQSLGIPIIKDIPFLGKLFSKTLNGHGKQYILSYLKLEEDERY